METLLCNKLQFHTFCERQGWLLLFDKMTDNESTVGGNNHRQYLREPQIN